MRHAPARPFDHSRIRGRGCACRCPLWVLFVVGGVVVVCIVAGWSLAFVGQSFVGRWLSLSSVRAVIELWGGAGSSGAGVCCGGGSCVTWHAGDKAASRVVVDIGDVAVWLSDLCVRR